MAPTKYIHQLKRMVRLRHGCGSRHLTTIPVADTGRGKRGWHGDVEMFILNGHAAAETCYAWSYEENGLTHATIILGIPPADSAEAAVKIAFDAKVRFSEIP